MPIQTFHEDFLWFKIEACNVVPWWLYIIRFNVDCHKREFIPYVAVTWEQTLSINCETWELTISWDGGNTVDLSCLCELCEVEPPVIPSNELVINVNDPEVVGKQYQSFANAFAYLASLPPAAAPSMYNRRAIRFSGTHTENITLPPYINLNGDGMLTAMLMWQVHLTAVVEPYSNTLSNCFVNNLYTYFGSWIPVFIPITMWIGHGVEFVPDSVRRTLLMTPPTGYDIVWWTYTVTIDGNTTTPIAYDAAPATVIAAIEALDSSYVWNIVLSSSWSLPDIIDYMVSFVWLPAGVPKTITADTTWLITNPVWWSILVKSTYTAWLIEQQLVWFSYPPTQGIWALRLLYNWFVYGTPNIVWSWSYTDMVPVVQAAIDTMFADIQAANPTAILWTPLVEEYTYWFKVTFNWFGWDTNMMTYWIDEKHNPLWYLGNEYSWIRVLLDHVLLAWCTWAQLSEWEISYLDMINDCKIFGWDYVWCKIMGNWLYVNAVMSDIHIYDSWISQWDIIWKNSYFYNTGFTSTNIFKELNITWDCSLHNCYIDGNVTIVDKLEASQSTFLKNVLVDTTWTFYDMSNVIGWTLTNLWIHSNLWEQYDNTISWLSSTNRKAAIDELQSMISWMSVLSWAWSPIWVVTPTFVWQRYLDSTWPTFYTAYWLTDTEWIS